MATYAIGDIQGCHQELLALLEKVNFSSSDRLWIAGDLVNRGPQSLETLRTLYRIKDQLTIVLGNHDLHMLAVHHGLTHTRKSDTLKVILAAPERDELMAWIQTQPIAVADHDQQWFMAHAGLPPVWTIEQALEHADEVSTVLQSDDSVLFFKHMYGNNPDLWRDELTGWDRLRIITNYLTRMRFCTPQGHLDLVTKEEIGTQPKGYHPWFELPPAQDHTYTVLFGHWAALEGTTNHSQIIALDTGCVWGGSLTALRLEDRTLFSVPSQS